MVEVVPMILDIDAAEAEVKAVRAKLRHLAKLQALEHTMCEKYYDVCPLNSYVSSAAQQSREYELLHSLHCIDFVHMSADLKQTVRAMTANLLGLPSDANANTPVDAPAVAAPPSNRWPPYGWMLKKFKGKEYVW
jgi:hypothetical protein